MKKYTLEDLIFSSESRCKCGAGLAYPKDGSQPDESSVFKIGSDWWCYIVLTGAPDPHGFTDKHQIFPFSLYKVKSEDQPSACGLSTRPKHNPTQRVDGEG